MGASTCMHCSIVLQAVSVSLSLVPLSWQALIEACLPGNEFIARRRRLWSRARFILRSRPLFVSTRYSTEDNPQVGAQETGEEGGREAIGEKVLEGVFNYTGERRFLDRLPGRTVDSLVYGNWIVYRSRCNKNRVLVPIRTVLSGIVCPNLLRLVE